MHELTRIETYAEVEQSETYYNITERTEFYIKVEDCDSVENLTDSFITQTKLQEKYSNIGNYYKWYDHSLIRNIVEEWSELLSETGLSTTRMTSKAKSLMYEVDNHIINYALRGKAWEVQGDRLIHKERTYDRKREREIEQLKRFKKQAQETAALPYERRDCIIHQDMSNIRRAGREVIKTKYDVDVHRYSITIPFLKRLCSWNDIAKELRKQLPKKQQREDIKFAKQLWFNPDTPLNYH